MFDKVLNTFLKRFFDFVGATKHCDSLGYQPHDYVKDPHQMEAFFSCKNNGFKQKENVPPVFLIFPPDIISNDNS